MRILYPTVLLVCFLLNIKGQSYNYYFGNLHAHTGFSDGNKDSLVSGVSTPAASYAYAKLSNDFDFLGISEHNHFSNNNPGFKLPRYAQGLSMANAANNDGDFLALFGMEYGVSSSNNGHVIIYGFDGLIGWEVGVGGVTGVNYNIFNPKNDYASLFKKVRNNPNAFCYLAHPFWTDFSLDGTDSNALAFSAYNSQFDSAIVGMPLRSGNAFSTFTNYNDYSPHDYFNYYKKLLHVGYHLGIGYDHDNHNTNFGRGNAGRLVVLMPSLSRANLFSAMQKMNFYGSDDANAQLDFSINGHIMGSIISGNYYPTIQLSHNDPDGEQADTIRIWKGFKNSSSWAYTIHTVINSNTASYTDYQIFPGTEYYYFAELRQKDGHWMVTSPIWYTPEKTLSIKNSAGTINHKVFPNPANEQLSISFGQCDDYDIEILDLFGKVILKRKFFDQTIKIDVSGFKSGLYLLKISDKENSIIEKIRVR